MPEEVTEPLISETVKEMETVYDHPTYFEDNYGVGNHVRPLFEEVWDHPWKVCLSDPWGCWRDVFESCPARDERQVRKRCNEEPIYL